MLSKLFSRHTLSTGLLFVGLFGTYLALSPGSIAAQGYTNEEMRSGESMLANLHAFVSGAPHVPMVWSRHGPLPVLLDLPFLALGKWLVSGDFVLSFQPLLLTAALVTLLHSMLRTMTSPGMSLLLTLTAGFGTMLWPYAYIGLETKQSFFLVLAAYLALRDEAVQTPSRLFFLSLVCGFAIAVKGTGVVLAPAAGYLLLLQLRPAWREKRGQSVVSLLVCLIIFIGAAQARGLYWNPLGGSYRNLRPWLIVSPIQFWCNAIGLLGSPTKGLFVYVPVTLITLFCLPRAFTRRPKIVILASLVVIPTIAFLCLLKFPVDEVWGPRYLHVLIAPLLLCIGAAYPRLDLIKATALVTLLSVGLVVSFLGAFYYYGLVDFVAKEAGQNTLEAVTGDTDWNQIQMNGRLFQVWLRNQNRPAIWTPSHIWLWTPPVGAQAWKGVDLRPFSTPQPSLVRLWHVPKSGASLNIFVMNISALIVGLSCLIWSIVNVVSDTRKSAGMKAAETFSAT